jgi:hypothetical protein
LAFVFASASYDDVDSVPGALARLVGEMPVVGGSAAGAMFEGGVVVKRGILVVLLGGDDVRVAVGAAPIASPTLIDVVPAVARIREEANAAASEGFEQALCLGFAPAVGVDGNAFTAALRKGAGVHMQLAGALTGDDFTFDRSRVFADGRAFVNRAVMAGVFSRRPVGVAARHGCQAAGPARVVTRSEGAWLVELDGRPAVDVWMSDVRAASGNGSSCDPVDLAASAEKWTIGLETRVQPEAIVRAQLSQRPGGGMLMSAEIAEGASVRLMRATRDRVLGAGREAASLASERLGRGAAGALVLSCAARLLNLGSRFHEEPKVMADVLGAPVAGVCVFGEIARGVRDVEAFHNSTTVVVAWPRE